MSDCPCLNCATECEGTCLACCLESNALTCEQFAAFLSARLEELSVGGVATCIMAMGAKIAELQKEASDDTAEAEEFRKQHA